MKALLLPADVQATILAERREARRAAAAFARVCAEGRADQLYNASLWLNECVGAWRPAMALVARLPRVAPEVRDAFVPVWVEHKMLALWVGDRPTLARALRVLMPRDYSGLALTLYRGTHAGERRRRLYSFSWTTDVATARSFAEHWSRAADQLQAKRIFAQRGIVLKTMVTPDAVLLTRQPEDYYDEGEVVVDPFRLGRVDVAERI
jgi:hypothetical protein